MATYLMSDGVEYHLYTLEFYRANFRTHEIEVAARICMRVPVDVAPELEAKDHLRHGRILRQWDNIRESTGDEISEYFRQHPDRLSTASISTDKRFQLTQKVC